VANCYHANGKKECTNCQSTGQVGGYLKRQCEKCKGKKYVCKDCGEPV